MRESYLETYSPPIPVVHIHISSPDEEQWEGSFIAIIDTGADFTIIPRRILASVKAVQIGSGVLSTQWKDRRSVNIYEVDLRIGEITLSYIEVAGDTSSDELILGRNVLNELDLRLDGPNHQLYLLSNNLQ